MNEYPDSEVQDDGTEIHSNCGGDIYYFKEGWICSKCKESGPDDAVELEISEKVVLGMELLRWIYWLVKPGNGVEEMIEAEERRIREMIQKVTKAPLN